MTIAIALALALVTSTGAPLATPGGEAAVTAYPANYFAASQPITALDMVKLLPGFSFDAGAQARGLASSGGNVLIDGARPAAKDDSLDQELQRIPASSILRIDLIRGGAPGIDMQGRTIIANVIRRRDLAGRVTITASVTHGLDPRLSAGFLIDAERRLGAARIELSLETGKHLDDFTGKGIWTRYRPDGRQEFTATESNLAAEDYYKATAAFPIISVLSIPCLFLPPRRSITRNSKMTTWNSVFAMNARSPSVFRARPMSCNGWGGY